MDLRRKVRERDYVVYGIKLQGQRIVDTADAFATSCSKASVTELTVLPAVAHSKQVQGAILQFLKDLD